jgi:hypothetical protein
MAIQKIACRIQENEGGQSSSRCGRPEAPHENDHSRNHQREHEPKKFAISRGRRQRRIPIAAFEQEWKSKVRWITLDRLEDLLPKGVIHRPDPLSSSPR